MFMHCLGGSYNPVMAVMSSMVSSRCGEMVCEASVVLVHFVRDCVTAIRGSRAHGCAGPKGSTC